MRLPAPSESALTRGLRGGSFTAGKRPCRAPAGISTMGQLQIHRSCFERLLLINAVRAQDWCVVGNIGVQIVSGPSTVIAITVLSLSAAALPALGTTVNAAEPTRISSVDLFVDFENHIGQEMLLQDGKVIFASSYFINIQSANGAVLFGAWSNNVDRESLRFFLTNCTDYDTPAQCAMPLLVVPSKIITPATHEFSSVRMVPQRSN